MARVRARSSNRSGGVSHAGADAGEVALNALLRRAGAIAGRSGALMLVMIRLSLGRPEDRAALALAEEIFGTDD